MATRVKKLNSKFLITLTVVVLGGTIAAFLAPVVFHRGPGNPKKLVADAEQALQNNQLDQARVLLLQAAGADPTNTDILVRLGDVQARLTPTDPAFLEQAHASWNKAVSIDPRCVPALNRLMASYWDFIELGTRADMYGRIKDLADKLLAVDPNNREIAARRHIVVIRQWLDQRTVPTQQLDAALAGLTDLMRKDPANPDLPRYLGKAKIRQAQAQVEASQNKQAEATLDGTTVMLDEVRKAQPNNAMVQLRAFQVYTEMSFADPRTKENPQAGPDDRYRVRAGEAIAAARKAVTDKDAAYDDIQETAARWAAETGKPEEAEQIVRAFYDGHKDDQNARLLMAKLLTGKKETREEAVKILSQEPPTREDSAGIRAIVLRELQIRTDYELALVRLGDAEGEAADADKRKQYLTDADAAIEKVRRLTGSKSVRSLELDGRRRLIRGENVDAVKVLEEAVAQMPADQANYQVMNLLANAYVRTRQPGAAKGLLEKILASLPNWPAPRLALAQIMIQEGDLTGGRRHLAVLRQLIPGGGPELDRLEGEAMVLEGKLNPRVNPEGYSRLPEANKDDRLRKAHAAMVLQKPDEAIRLLRLVLGEDPKDVGSWRALAMIYESRGQRERAKQVIDDALKANPDDPSLNVVALRLGDAKPEELYAALKAVIEKSPDEYTREAELYDLERGPGGHPDLALAHLARAHQLKPTDVRVLDQLYQTHVQAKEFAQAEPYLKELVDLNADECGGLLYRQRFAMAKGDYAAADDLGYQLVERFRQFAASWLSLGQAQQARGKFVEAVNSYLEVRKRQPNHYDAMRGLVDCYYALSRIDDAKRTLLEGRQRFPDDTTVRELYLNHVVNYGNPAEAIGDRKQLLADHPDEAGFYLALAATYFHAARYEASAPPAAAAAPVPGAAGAAAAPTASRTGEYLNEAFKTLSDGAARFPDDGRFYGQMAEMHQFANRLDSAREVLENFARRDSVRDTPGPYLLIYDMWTRAGQYDKAEQALGDALVRSDRSENKLDIRLKLVATMVQARKYAEAMATLEGAATNADPRVVRQRIEILIAQNKLPEAEAATIRALAADGTSVDLRNLLSSILIDTGRVAAAQQHLAAARAIDPRNEVTRYLTALSMAKQDRPDIDGAIKELIEVRERNPRNVQIRLLLAELYRSTARPDYAIRELKEGLQKLPLSKELRLTLIQLYRAHRPPDYQAALDLAVAAQKDPALRSDVEWARQEAICWTGMKNAPQAILTMREKVIKQAPDNVEYGREFLDMVLQAGEYDAVLRESDRMLKAGTDTWWLRHQRGLSLAKRKVNPQPDEAIKEFDKALAFADAAGDGNTAEFILRGMSAAVRPDGYEQALKRVQGRLANDPEGRWHLLSASFVRGKGDFAAATKTIEQMLADPANKPRERREPILRAAADVYQNAPVPNNAKAIAAYQELLLVTPDDLAALNNLAYLKAEIVQPPDPKQAKIYSGKAYDVSRLSGTPNDMIFDTHGWVLTLCGGEDASQGLKILDGVVKRRPDFIEGHFHLGVSYLQQALPSYPLAEKELQRALDLMSQQEQAGESVDAKLKDRVQAALVKAKDRPRGKSS